MAELLYKCPYCWNPTTCAYHNQPKKLIFVCHTCQAGWIQDDPSAIERAHLERCLRQPQAKCECCRKRDPWRTCTRTDPQTGETRHTLLCAGCYPQAD